MDIRVDEKRRGVPRYRQAMIDHDRDWAYTGQFFRCLDCGHEFRQPPYDFEVCPECGTDFWPQRE